MLRHLLIAALLLGGIEGLAYWWMHPAPAVHNLPVLVHRPGLKNPQQQVSPPTSSSPQQSSYPSSTSESQPANFQLLPEIYAKSAPTLRCTGGQVFLATLDERINAYCAFFEWDGTDAGSVLEAFRHVPEICMGSIGMELVSEEKAVIWQVGSTTLIFDHAIFRDPSPLPNLNHVHSFRAVWVAGRDGNSASAGIDGKPIDQLRSIRIKSALQRYQPAHARVIQGSIRGASTNQSAWQAFQQAMLQNLVMETR